MASQLIPDLNTRPLALQDFYAIADNLGIDADEMPLRRLHGCSFPDDDGDRVIRVNSLITEPQRIIAGFHELGHVALHTLDGVVFASLGPLWNHRRDECEAEMIGVLALMPLSAISEMNPNLIAAKFRVPKKTAKFRVQVYERYGI